MRLGLGLLAVCLLVLTWSQISPEMRAFVRDQTTGPSTVVNLPADLGELPRSAEGTYFALNACRDALSTPLTTLLERTDRAHLTENCAALSAAALEKSPSLAHAYVVQALSSKLAGDMTEAEASYRLSEVVSGDSIGLALTRTRMMLPALDRVAPDTRAVLARDVIRLTRSWRGSTALADFYIREPQAQPFIIETVTTLEDDVQRRFLSAVRRANQ